MLSSRMSFYIYLILNNDNCLLFCHKVPESGNYTFYVACDDACELWLDTQQGSKLASGNDDEESGRILLADLKQEYWTDHNQGDK